MRAIDANVLARLITRDDAKQVAAAENYVAQGAWVSHLVLAETVWVLESVYSRQSREIAAAVELLLDSGKIVLQDPAVVAGALATFRLSHSRDGQKERPFAARHLRSRSGETSRRRAPVTADLPAGKTSVVLLWIFSVPGRTS